MQRDDTPSATSANPLELDPIWIPGLIEDLQTEGAVGGVNAHMIHSNEGGLLIIIQPYQSMAHGDWIEVFWGNDDSPVSSGSVEPEHVDRDFPMYVAASRVPEGINELHAQVTRSGGGNGGSTPRMPILVRTEIPGGIDPDPSEPNHQDLLPPEPELPPGGIIDEDAAKAGIKVTIPGYPNMRLYDVIQLSWGGVKVLQEVTQADMDAGFTVILVTEESILKAGDSDQLLLTYAIRDEVHNPSDGWSMGTYITVEIGEGLFDAPLIDNPNPDADPIDVIDLDELGDEDLLVSVMVLAGGGLLRDDELTLKWVGTNSQDESVTVDLGPVPVTRVPGIIDFLVPNADVRGLGQGRGVASYTATRAGAALGASKRSFVTFLGAEQRLPKPIVEDAFGGTLDPALPGTTVIVPGEALEAGDTVFLTWLGTRANGTPVLKTEQRGVSGGGAGQPMRFSIGSEYIAPLDGGSVEVYYRLHKDSSDTELESDRERLQVGEASFELPAPTTRPAAQDGVLDPAELPGQLELVVPPWPGMRDGQTVHILWRASNGVDHSDFMRISAPMEGHEVLFTMDQAKVEEFLGEAVTLSYRVESPDQDDRHSHIASFNIGARKFPLPAPEILEADGGVIDPDTVPNGATIRIGATAQFQADDQVTLHIVGVSEEGSIVITETIPASGADKELLLPLPFAVIDANSGGTFTLKYEITRASGGPAEESETVTYSVSREIGSGVMRVMGARFNVSTMRGERTPRIIKALHEDSLLPMRAEWRYEDESAWTTATQWDDVRPWLKLYVRNEDEAWELRPANIFGTGWRIYPDPNAWAGFTAMRDEVMSDAGPVVDLVAWGNPRYGGALSQEAAAAKNVASVSATMAAFVARLQDGNLVCWGMDGYGGTPTAIEGDFVDVVGNAFAFVGRKADGELHAWGASEHGGTLPQRVLDHRDYVQICRGYSALAALRANGQAVAWGFVFSGGVMEPGQDLVTDIVQLMSSGSAFVALRDNNGSRSLMAWGHEDGGAKLPPHIASLTNVRSLLASTSNAFCIQLDTGYIRAWPHHLLPGNVPDDVADLTNIESVSGTTGAFCALLSTGKVRAWGYEREGGKLTAEAAGKSNIIQVIPNISAFAALCSDGTVIAWGNEISGGDTSAVVDQLVDVRAVYGNALGFTALTADGRVVTWGVPGGGGDSSTVQHLLNGKVTHSRLLSTAEAEAVAQGVDPASVRT